MKRLFLIILCLIGTVIFAGCSSGSELTIDINDLGAMLRNDIEFTSELTEIDYKYIQAYFEIADTTGAVMYESNSTCEEIAIFEAASPNETEVILESVNTFLTDQRKTFAAYSPDDARRIDDAVIESNDTYIVLVVCDTPERARELIKGAFDGKIIPEKKDTDKASDTDMQSDADKNTSDSDMPSDLDENTSESNVSQGVPDNTTTEYETITSNDKVKVYDGLTVVGSAGFSFYGYSKTNTEKYTSALNKLADTLDNSATIYSIPVPLSCAITFPDNLAQYNKSYDQNKALSSIGNMLNSRVRAINMYDLLMQHRKEYLYFRTDHHWTALGAYYAYTLFCEEKGITPIPLSDYEAMTFTDFRGSYIYDKDKNIIDQEMYDNPDTVTAYLPTAEETYMHVYTKDDTEFDWDVIKDVTNYPSGSKYLTFAAGDYPLAVLYNKDKNDGSACMVIKDSFGNAFVPFLVDHYQTVYEIDFRYWSGSLADFAKEHNVSDILFVTAITNTGSSYSAGKISSLCD